MRLHAEPDFTAVAAIIPTTLVGAIIGYLSAGPMGFLACGALTGGIGALLGKRVSLMLERA